MLNFHVQCPPQLASWFHIWKFFFTTLSSESQIKTYAMLVCICPPASYPLPSIFTNSCHMIPRSMGISLQIETLYLHFQFELRNKDLKLFQYGLQWPFLMLVSTMDYCFLLFLMYYIHTHRNISHFFKLNSEMVWAIPIYAFNDYQITPQKRF